MKGKKPPKSPDEHIKRLYSTPGDTSQALVAGAKARMQAQQAEKRLKRMGKEKIIRREE